MLTDDKQGGNHPTEACNESCCHNNMLVNIYHMQLSNFHGLYRHNVISITFELVDVARPFFLLNGLHTLKMNFSNFFIEDA